VALDDVLSYT